MFITCHVTNKAKSFGQVITRVEKTANFGHKRGKGLESGLHTPIQFFLEYFSMFIYSFYISLTGSTIHVISKFRVLIVNTPYHSHQKL